MSCRSTLLRTVSPPLVVLFSAVPDAVCNYIYVWATNKTSISYGLKQVALFVISAVKTFTSLVIVPAASAYATNTSASAPRVVFAGRAREMKFRNRVTITTLVTLLTAIATPIIVVVMTDERCIKNFFSNSNSQSTTVQTNNLDRSSYRHYSISFTWEYQPEFEFDAEQCVTAVVSTYYPVLISTAFLTGVFVPALKLALPLCVKRPRELPCIVKLAVDIFEVWGLCEESTQHQPMEVAETIVENAFTMLLTNLALVLTFGFAAPLIAAAVGFGTVGALGAALRALDLRQASDGLDPSVNAHFNAHLPTGCTRIPPLGFVMVVVAALLVWIGLCVGFLLKLFVGIGLAIGLASGSALLGCLSLFRERAARQSPRSPNSRLSGWSILEEGECDDAGGDDDDKDVDGVTA